MEPREPALPWGTALGATGSFQQKPHIPDAAVGDSVLDLVADLQLFEQQLAVIRRRARVLAGNPAPSGRQLPSRPEAQQQQLQQQKEYPAIPSTDVSWTQLLLPGLAASDGSSRGVKRCAGQLSVPGSEPRPAKPNKATKRQQAEVSNFQTLGCMPLLV